MILFLCQMKLRLAEKYYELSQQGFVECVNSRQCPDDFVRGNKKIVFQCCRKICTETVLSGEDATDAFVIFLVLGSLK